MSNRFKKAGAPRIAPENNFGISEPSSSDALQSWDILSKKIHVTCDFNDYVTADDGVLSYDIVLPDQEICNGIMHT